MQALAGDGPFWQIYTLTMGGLHEINKAKVCHSN